MGMRINIMPKYKCLKIYTIKANYCLFIVTLILFLFTSCLTWKKMYDRIPQEEPKGYIDFYIKRWNLGVVNKEVNIYQGEFETKKYLSEVRSHNGFFAFGVGLSRVAFTPGEHTITVAIGNGFDTKTVKVVQGMITPFAINIKKAGSKYYKGGFAYIPFRLNSEIKEPVPFR
jgi:NRPS condensation-like uncharacterized protein